MKARAAAVATMARRLRGVSDGHRARGGLRELRRDDAGHAQDEEEARAA